MDNLADRFLKDRRFSRRHCLRTPLRVRIWKSAIPEQRTESLNLSEQGIYFATSLPISEGEIVEVLLKMPEEITGEPTTEWRCTGRVVRAEPVDSPRGNLGLGVQFYCYVVARSEQPELPLSAYLPGHANLQIAP